MGASSSPLLHRSPPPPPPLAQLLLNLWFRFLQHCSGQNKPSLPPTTTPGPSQPQHSPSARAEAPELLLPGLAWSGATAPTVSRQAPFTLLPATGTINPTRQGREGGGRRKANPARRAGIRPGCALGALKTKNQGQARTPNATLTHTDIHDSVCGNAGRRHACLVTSLPGSAPGICNWRARPWSVFFPPRRNYESHGS